MTETVMSILVVDDTQNELNETAEALCHAGFNVTKCDWSTTAIEELREKAFRCDCLVTDYAMVPVSGMELIKSIRKIPHRDRLPFVIHTGGDLAGDLRYLATFARKNGGKAIAKNRAGDFTYLATTIRRLIAGKTR